MPGPRRALATLCTTEIVSYGVLYYAFPVLAGTISASTGWSRTAVTAAFSAGNLAAAGAGIPVGRVIDRYGPRPVMTGGSVLAVAAVLGIAAAPGFGWFLAAWLVAGIAMAGVFYPPAFAALTGWYGPERVAALTTLTLAAGFASTIFAPLTAVLNGPLSWRGVYVALAVILGVVTIPAHLWGLTLPWTLTRARPAVDAAQRVTPDPMKQVLTSRRFLTLLASMTLSAFVLYAVVVNLVPLLTGRGLSSTAAAWALGLGGVGQVAGRLCYRALAARAGVRARTVTILALGAGTTFSLAVVPGPAALLIAAAVLAGAARGLFTLLEATLVADHWGAARYATVNGVFTAPLTAAMAIAPTLGAAVATGTGSYPALFLILTAAGITAAVLAALTGPPTDAVEVASVGGASIREVERLPLGSGHHGHPQPGGTP